MKTRLRAKQEDTRTRGSEPSVLASKFGVTSVSVSEISKDLALMQENKIDTSSPEIPRHLLSPRVSLRAARPPPPPSAPEAESYLL